jgi:hypothetical protein
MSLWGDNGRMDQPRAAAEQVRSWDRPIVTYPLFALIAAIGGLFGSFSLSAYFLVFAVGGTLFWLGMTGRAGRRGAPRRLPRGSAWWMVPVLVFAFTELLSFSRGSTSDFPTLSLLADPFLDHYLARTAVYFGWLVAYWGLVRR